MQPNRREKVTPWLAERVIGESAGRTSRQTRNLGGAPLRSGGAAAPLVPRETRNRFHSWEVFRWREKGRKRKHSKLRRSARPARALFGKARLISVWSTFPLIYIPPKHPGVWISPFS